MIWFGKFFLVKAYGGLVALGIKRGDRVVVMGDAEGGTRVAYLAVQCAGGLYFFGFFFVISDLWFSHSCLHLRSRSDSSGNGVRNSV